MIGPPLGRIWLAASAVAAGAVAAGHVPQWTGVAAVCGGGAALLVRRHPAVAAGGIALVSVGAGLLVAGAQGSRGSPLIAMAEAIPRCRLTGRIEEQLGGLGTLATVARAKCANQPPWQNPGEIVFEAPDADAGATYVALGWLLPIGSDRFDTQRARLGADAVLEPVDVEVGRVRGLLPRVAADVRAGLEDATSSLDARAGAMLRGLSIGDVRGIDPATEEILRRAGLSHLVAVSGSNVAIVLGTVALLCSRIGLRMRISLAAVVLMVFVAIVGPEPSVLRAALMGGVGLFAILIGRRAEPLHALGLAIIVLLCLRPAMVHSIGLHLSAAATAGIILWTAPVRRWMGSAPDWIATPLAATMAAQAAVAPLLVTGFGELSIVAPVSNLLAFPAVPVTTVLGLGAGIAGAVSPPLGGVLARIAEPAAAWILEVGERAGSQPWSSILLAEWSGVLLTLPVVAGAVLALRTHSPHQEE